MTGLHHGGKTFSPMQKSITLEVFLSTLWIIAASVLLLLPVGQSLPMEPSLTVINPRTKRPIKVHGPTFQALLQSGFVYHEDTLYPIQPGRYDEPILSTAWREVEQKDDDDQQLQQQQQQQQRNGVLFVYKPSGLLTVPGREQPDCLIARVLQSAAYTSATVCHRLDRDTSGVMALALNAQVHSQVSKQFETRQTTKIYTALVAGHVQQDEGLVDLPIGKAKTAEGFNRWVIDGTKPRDARTKWKVDKRFQLDDNRDDGFCYTRVLVQPLTGRGQQIRLHMKALGHPLLGDTLHAPPLVATATPRLCLHATSLGFHVDKAWVQSSVPSPF